MNERLKMRAYHQFEEMAQNRFATDILLDVVMAAATYWEGIDPMDFCIQDISTQAYVFGSINRLIWTPSAGFRPVKSYCTEGFLANCSRIGPLPAPTSVLKAYTSDLLKELLHLPGDSKIFVKVPGGGDWSNTDLEINDECPLIVVSGK